MRFLQHPARPENFPQRSHHRFPLHIPPPVKPVGEEEMSSTWIIMEKIRGCSVDAESGARESPGARNDPADSDRWV
jgi:hypothetical protein